MRLMAQALRLHHRLRPPHRLHLHPQAAVMMVIAKRSTQATLCGLKKNYYGAKNKRHTR